MFLIKKEKPKVYFAYDIWEFFTGTNWEQKIKRIFQKKFEKICFKRAQGVFHKGPAGELDFLSYDVNAPDLAITPDCLDEWIYPPKTKQKNKEPHLVYIGGPTPSWKGKISFFC